MLASAPDQERTELVVGCVSDSVTHQIRNRELLSGICSHQKQSTNQIIEMSKAMLMELSPATAAAEIGNWSIVIDCIQKLSLAQLQHNERVLDLALQVLTQGDFEQQWEIAKIVPKLGEIAIQPLLNLVNDRDIELENRWFGTRILGEFARPQVVTALVALIREDEDPELTAIAIGALTKIGTPAIAALTDLLAPAADPDGCAGAERGIAIAILARIRHSQTIEPLIRVSDDPDPQIRTLIIEALGSFHEPQILPILIAKLTDAAASVRTAAVVALCLRGDQAIELELLHHLRPLLFDLDSAVCTATALGLARLADPQAVAVLTELLASPRTTNDLRAAVILALGWIGTRAAIDSLIAALASALELAPAVIMSISKTERERIYASQMLVTYLHSHPDPAMPIPAIVRQEIAAALGNLGNIDTVPVLVELSGDPDDRVRLHAMTALAKLAPTLPPQIVSSVDR